MDLRHRTWDEMFAVNEDTYSSLQSASDHSNHRPSAMPSPSSVNQLEELWAQSVALREHALHVRAVSMEVRAVARDMRLRRAAA
jgi:hypothetical protein